MKKKKKLILPILTLILVTVLGFSQYLSDNYKENALENEERIKNVILNTNNLNFTHLTESLFFIELHNFELHENFDIAKKMEDKILNKRKEIIISYYELANEDTKEVNEKINNILNNETTSFGEKYNELIKIYNENTLIQNNIFDPIYSKRESNDAKAKTFSIIVYILAGLIFILELVKIFFNKSKK